MPLRLKGDATRIKRQVRPIHRQARTLARQGELPQHVSHVEISRCAVEIHRAHFGGALVGSRIAGRVSDSDVGFDTRGDASAQAWGMAYCCHGRLDMADCCNQV